METLDPVTLVTGGSALGLMVTLAIVLLRHVTSQSSNYRGVIDIWRSTAEDARERVRELEKAVESLREEVRRLTQENDRLRAAASKEIDHE